MQGLAQGPMPPEPGAAPAAAPGPGAPAQAPNATGAAVEPASSEEQALYNRVVAMAMLAIFNEKMAPKIAENIKTAPEPEKAMGEVAATLAMRVNAHMKEQGEPVPGDVMMHAGMEIVEHLGEVAETIGMEVTSDSLERAYYHALDHYRSMAQQNGEYGEEQALEDAAMLQQIDQSGAFEQIMQSLQAAQNEGVA